MNRRFDDNGYWRLLKLWPVIISLLLVATAFAVVQVKVDLNSKGLDENKIEHDEFRTRITRLENMPEMITEMRNDIKTLIKSRRYNRPD